MSNIAHRPVMMDVARAAGVSQTTVSLVLNGVPGIRISDPVRQRVMAAAASLGYRVGARGAGRMRVLGFLADELSTSPFAVLSADGARDAALPANAIVVIAVCGGDVALEAAVLDLWRSQSVAGVMYSRIFSRRVDPPPQLTQHRSVLLNCFDADHAYSAVVPAEQRGGATATRHLLAAGHRRIAMINGEPWMQAAQDRATGYRRALREAGVAVESALMRQGDWTAASGREHTFTLMALSHPPTAIFCANDQMAAGCYEALRRLGLDIPTDVSVIGYDNQPVSRLLDPPLTTLDLPHVEMGRWATEQLLGAEGAAKTIRLECRLIERRSVGALGRPVRTPPDAILGTIPK